MLFPDSSVAGSGGCRWPGGAGLFGSPIPTALAEATALAEENRLLIHYVAYREEHYSCPAACILGIRELLAQDWRLVELRGGTLGPFLALWRKDDGT